MSILIHQKMFRVSTILLTLVTYSAASNAAIKPAPYPTTEVLGAFSKVCKTQPNMAKLLGAAKDLGWIKYKPAKDGAMDRGIKMIGSPLAGGGPDPAEVHTLQKDVAGRYLELSFVHYAQIKGDAEFKGGYSCSVNDFGAEQNFSPSELLTWAGRAPTSPSNLAPIADAKYPNFATDKVPIFSIWDPSVLENAAKTILVFTPHDSIFNFGGLIGISISSAWDEAKENK